MERERYSRLVASAPTLRMLRHIALALLCLLAGCVSMPVSTLWKLRHFDEQAFVALDPAQLRAAVLAEHGVRMQAGKVKLDLRLEFDNGYRQDYHAGMRELAAGVADWPGLGPAPQGFAWTVMALSEQGAAELRRFQQAFKGKPADTSASVVIDIKLDETGISQNREPFEAEFWLLMRPQEGFLQFLKRTTVEPAKIGNENKK